jgi:hypothetical protein
MGKPENVVTVASFGGRRDQLLRANPALLDGFTNQQLSVRASIGENLARATR